MNIRSENHVRLAGPCGLRWRAAIATITMCCAGLLAAGVIFSTPCRAAEIPAWLDDAITKANGESPETPIRFVDIKDSFVWYTIARTPEVGHQQIRSRINTLVLGNNYVPLSDEETVTTARPPVASGAASQKKCWNRSYMKGTKTGSSGQGQGMLTTYVCEDKETWWAAFRLAR